MSCRCVTDTMDMMAVKASAAGFVTFLLCMVCLLFEIVYKCQLRRHVRLARKNQLYENENEGIELIEGTPADV